MNVFKPPKPVAAVVVAPKPVFGFAANKLVELAAGCAPKPTPKPVVAKEKSVFIL